MRCLMLAHLLRHHLRPDERITIVGLSPAWLPALVTLAPLKRWVKLVTETLGEALSRLPPMNRTICGVLPVVEFPASYTASTTRRA